MKPSKQRLSIDEAKQIDLVDYLSQLGHTPTKIRNNDYWYLSPLREEKTPSFKVNRKLNCWYDHGTGMGGNVIDFAIRFHNCTVAEFLKEINGVFSFHQRPSLPFHKVEKNIENRIEILNEKTLSSLTLERYITTRRIPIEVAKEYCKEVSYKLNDKAYYGIGFKNDSGGYELRNEYCIASSSPTDIRTINIGAKEVMVFEGFFDILSFISIQQNLRSIHANYVILNSLSFFERARHFIEQHERIKLYFDRDLTGQKFSYYALYLSNKYQDESHLYKNYRDLNDWIMERVTGKVLNDSID